MKAIGVAELSNMIVWALPLWTSRREGAAPLPQHDQSTVILRPQPAKGKEPASLWYDLQDGVLCSRREVKNRDFWQLMKDNGLEWNAAKLRYERRLNARTGAPTDRVAELASILYKAGWPVALGSMEMADLVIEGRWLPEQKRWVSLLTSGDLLLTWEKGGDAVFKALEHMPTARWDTRLQGTVVDKARAADVRDFAEEWRFGVTAKALAVIESSQPHSPKELLGLKLPASPAQPARKPRATLAEDQGEEIIPEHLRFAN